jgi:hypothetical protein
MGVDMSVSIITRKVEARLVTIKLVDGSLVNGKINLHRSDVEIQRVSELFTRVADPFIVVFDATAEGKSGRVLILNKRNIIWITPEDGPQPRDDARTRETAVDSLLNRLRTT